MSGARPAARSAGRVEAGRLAGRRAPGCFAARRSARPSASARARRGSKGDVATHAAAPVEREQEVVETLREDLAAADPVDSTWTIPRSIHDIDNGKILGFDADLSEDHPGYHDADYKERRKWIADLARDLKVGERIPRLEYLPEERETWAKALKELQVLFPTHACREFLEAVDRLDFRPDVVPQLQDVHEILQETTGFAIRPVAGLLHPRDFLNGLAFKTFHSTQYMRHFSQPNYTPEPDLIHEIIGHIPMLTNQYYADMVQQIGLASLYATDKEIWHLTKVYWYTVEFGLVKEGEEVKAFGAGVLSSYGELDHAVKSGRPDLAPLDPWAKQPKMSYKDGFQKKYFVLNSFEEGAELLRTYSREYTDREFKQ
mmetsp:Transcript_5268/g.13184  ORF Transcript_5268/g.13184 Transcript_5268/m.13184 type:complete len:372 (+) Transcript_5268:206-1321(+)